MKRYFFHKDYLATGYSVLELMIVVGIMTLLATLVVVYSSRGFNTDLNVASASVSQVISEAREKTLASVDDTTWQVVMSGQSYALECNRETNCKAERTYDLPQNVEFEDDYTIEFERLTGATTAVTITLNQTNGANDSAVIFVSNSGVVGAEDVPIVVSPNNLGARHIYISDGPQLDDGDIISLSFSGAGSGEVELSDIQSSEGYYVYSGVVETGGGSAQFDMVAEVAQSPAEYHLYFDGTDFSGIGVEVEVNTTPLMSLETDGDVSGPYTEYVY